MNSKIKTILIIAGVAIALILVYVFFIKKPADVGNLTTTSGTALPNPTTNIDTSETVALSKNFLSTLLNVKSIKLDDSIFSEKAFLSLRDSTILLTPDGTEGRHNPFAPIGSDFVASPVDTNTNNLEVIDNGVDTGPSSEININAVAPKTPSANNSPVPLPKN